MRVDPNTLLDGYDSISNGINSNVPPFEIPRNQMAWGVNVTFRNQIPTTRPGWTKRPLTFRDTTTYPDGTSNPPVTVSGLVHQENFETKIFQGAIGFERRKQIVVSVGGKLFRIRPDVWDCIDITPEDAYANPNLYRAWFCEAEEFIIRQDGSSAPWVFDGGSTRILDSAGINGVTEMPVGTSMIYSQGRIVVARGDGRAFVVGDIVGGPSGTPQYNFKDAVLRFTENEIIALGGSFSVPINAGPITAVRPVAQVDTSTGQGPTQIFTQNAIFSLNTPTDRTTWKSVTYPIQTFSVVQSGATSDRSTIPVNGDLWMRGLDGVRSFVVARRDFGSWVNTPQSSEVNRALDKDDLTLLEYSSAAMFDNRLMMTTRPYRAFEHGVVHRGLVVIDFDPVSSIGVQAKPVWEGVWCGLNILQVLSATFDGITRCFVFSLSPDNKIELWEMSRTEVADSDGETEIPIGGSIETCAYRFPNQNAQDGELGLKKLRKAYLWLNDLQGTFTMTASYRANSNPAWTEWHEWSECTNTQTCSEESCTTPLNLRAQTRGPIILPEPSGECDESLGVPDNLGENFQIKVEFAGHAQISRILAVASIEQQDVNSICPADAACTAKEYCEPDDFAYSVYT